MKRKFLRAAALAAALAFFGLALPGCPDDDDDGTYWSIGFHGDANPGSDDNGGFTGVIVWDW